MMRRMGLLVAAVLTANCSGSSSSSSEREGPLSPTATFAGIPLNGNVATAQKAGFLDCLDSTVGLRCRRNGIRLLGSAPLSAGVDFNVGDSDHKLRFDHVTFWHERDQGAILELRPLLYKAGWRSCLVSGAELYWRPASSVQIAIDTSFWSTRRMIVGVLGKSHQACL